MHRMWMRHVTTACVASRLDLFHPDYTVGAGVPPAPAIPLRSNAKEQLVGYTTDREFSQPVWLRVTLPRGHIQL